MSGNDTSGVLGRVSWSAWLRHVGTSLLPLSLFVTGVLGYERLRDKRTQVAQQGQSAPSAASRSAVATAATLQPADPAQAPAVQSSPAPPPEPVQPPGLTAIQPQATASAPSAAANLRDDRNLLDLIPIAQIASPQATPAPTTRNLVLDIAPNSPPLPLAISALTNIPAGAYGMLRGVPQNAQLTHGLSVGNDTWLVDGADLPLLALEMRSGVAGRLALELTVLSTDSRVLAKEWLDIDVREVAASLSKLELRHARETQLVAGRGSLILFEISPKGAAPKGAYMLLRGLPLDAVLSRGLLVGPNVWLLNQDEMIEVEVRLPAKSAGNIDIAAKLVTAEGELLAEHTARLDVTPVTPAARAAEAKAAPLAAGARLAAAPSAPVPQTPLLKAPIPQAPIPKSKAALAEDKVAGNPLLARGRKMLELGNVAVARPLLERAAGEGSGEAAALLGASYDAAWLLRTGAIGMAGDDAQARRWYAEARRLGTADIDKVVGTPAARSAPSVFQQRKRS